MTEKQVIELIANTLGIACSALRCTSDSRDFAEWDSMGALSLVMMLDGEGVRVEPDDIDRIRSVQGILTAFREAGKLSQ